jgi:hypothetical protein
MSSSSSCPWPTLLSFVMQLSGQRPREIAVSVELHSRLHCCDACGAYWEQSERYADVVDEVEARKLYPEAFSAKRSK